MLSWMCEPVGIFSTTEFFCFLKSHERSVPFACSQWYKTHFFRIGWIEHVFSLFRLWFITYALLPWNSFFRSKSPRKTNFRKLKECFVQFFSAVQMRPLWGSKYHLGSFWQFFAIFVKSKKRASAPSRERIYVVAQLFYQDLKTKPDANKLFKISILR